MSRPSRALGIRARFVALAVAGVCALAVPVAQEAAGVFQGEAAERFLAGARVRGMRDLGEGVTRPQRATLELDGVTRFAIFKTIDVVGPGIIPADLGGDAPDFQDSWRTEVAAYVLDRLVGLRMVPATVERRVNNKDGSLQWWVDSAMTEAARIQQALAPADGEAWERQVLKMRLFDVLICNTDRNPSNFLVTKAFELRLIDHSRAFRSREALDRPERLTRFSQSLLDGLRRLTQGDLKARAGRYLTDPQIAALMQRRDAILDLVRAQVAARGAAAVIYP